MKTTLQQKQHTWTITPKAYADCSYHRNLLLTCRIRVEAWFSSNATRAYMRPSVACVSCVLACGLLCVACVYTQAPCVACVALDGNRWLWINKAVNYQNNRKRLN